MTFLNSIILKCHRLYISRKEQNRIKYKDTVTTLPVTFISRVNRISSVLAGVLIIMTYTISKLNNTQGII